MLDSIFAISPIFRVKVPIIGDKLELVKEDKVAAGRILYVAGEALRLGAVLLSPVMPHRTRILLDALNAHDTDTSWGRLNPNSMLKDHEPLFPRIK